MFTVEIHRHLKGLCPLPPTPADSQIWDLFDFSENVDFGNFSVGFGVWGGCNRWEMAVPASSDKFRQVPTCPDKLRPVGEGTLARS